MPAATKDAAGDRATETANQERIFLDWEKNNKDIQIPVCFRKMSQEPRKNFPHTKQVGNYLVGKIINKGSFAKVMEGLHIPTGEKVAIKVIDKKKAKQDSYVLKNMKREPWIHQMIKHPNIVQLYETLETENSYYMVMELCLGGDLMDRICEKKKLEEREVKKYTRQIMSAVEHLHRHKIVHRDLKIENFLLDESNGIKIVDFGLSNIMKSEGLSQELLSTQCGSPAYAAPELLAHKKYGPKVDVWSMRGQDTFQWTKAQGTKVQFGCQEVLPDSLLDMHMVGMSGVSMFAMLTGTLPFTVEPFNIKQLHLKMVNGEMNPIPPNISTGAVHFMHSLLEPDPAKRPAIKEAMKDKWLNDSNIRKSVNLFTYKNRLHPDELNPVVLSYMKETMESKLSNVVSLLINNKPSSITATYYLLLKKLMRYQKEHRPVKILLVEGMREAVLIVLICWALPSDRIFGCISKFCVMAVDAYEQSARFQLLFPTLKSAILEVIVCFIHLAFDFGLECIKKKSAPEKLEDKPPGNIREGTDIPASQKIDLVPAEKLENGDSKAEFPSVLNSEVPNAIQEDEIAITLENQEILPEVSKFADRELVHFEPPKSPENCSHELLNQTQLNPQENIEDVKNFADVRKSYLAEKPPSALANNPTYSINHQAQRSSMSCISRVTPRSATENRIVDPSPVAFPETRVKDLLKAMEENITAPMWQYQEKDSSAFLIMETPQLSPLLKLRQVSLRDPITKKTSWMTASTQQPNSSPPFCVKSSRPPIFPVAQQQMLMMRSLRKSKEKPDDFFNTSKVKRNLVQMKHLPKDMDLNLPALSPPYQSRSGKKPEILRLDFA
ncbi:Hormonally up-regulated neu tumor-associated kinase [Varanus komodoensis]|nr:Hormonally up-regulated neu tumor-associated kinase [Varanus komodoensis]